MSDSIDEELARRAAGFTVEAGKHVAADGLVARSGRRRILPDAGLDSTWTEDRVEQLAAVAEQVLHGRQATVFEERVLNPLMGKPKRPIESLATQFGVTSERIYRIAEKGKERVRAAAQSMADTPSDDAQEKAFCEAWKQTCAVCGRRWVLSWHDVCPKARCWFFQRK